MPLYEYQCQQCSERVEILQRWSDPPYAHCPKCGGEMKKLQSSPAIQFKGSGFYKTDYASGGRNQSKSDSKNDTKSESSGPASKPDGGSSGKSSSE
ncbi:MAG TPA: FmdB family zinc ribbon protein [Thermoanaerobaculia bacterium]|nr:FmdB family zinc ribbon protein [Thermoanaerobaculia bacterium]